MSDVAWPDAGRPAPRAASHDGARRLGVGSQARRTPSTVCQIGVGAGDGAVVHAPRATMPAIVSTTRRIRILLFGTLAVDVVKETPIALAQRLGMSPDRLAVHGLPRLCFVSGSMPLLRSRVLALLSGALLAASCTVIPSTTAPVASPSPSPYGLPSPGLFSSAAVFRELPVLAATTDRERVCAGEGWGLPLRLVDSAAGIVAADGRSNHTITWPHGYRAVFDPAFVAVITDTGAVFAYANEDINRADATGFHGHMICIEGLFIEIWPIPSPR
jgi:hypothetical protein